MSSIPLCVLQISARTALAALLLGAAPARAQVGEQPDWRQWGGPQRDFTTFAPPLAESWEANEEPVELFRHDLLGGHSAISVADGVAYVSHGKSGVERITALDGRGNVLWETENEVGYTASVASHDGPHAAPLVLPESLITVSIDATVRARSLVDGSLLWMRDLRRDHGLVLPQAGYAASPLLVGNSILLPGLGGAAPDYRRIESAGLGVLCLATNSGETIWAKQSFPSSHSSPILIETAGSRAAIFHGMEKIVAVDPESGSELWDFSVRNGAADNVSFTPVWDKKNRTLIVSHAYDRSGAQAIRVDESGGAPARLWSNPRLKVEHGNGLLWQDMLIGSDGSEPGFLVALEASTGKLLWKDRIAKAGLLGVGNQMVLLLDSDGTLHLARPTAAGPGIVSSRQILGELSWTAPTLVGRVLFARGPRSLVALRLP